MPGLVELLGSELLSKVGEPSVGTTEALAGKKAVALYFSAHWCPPCRGFTPKFSEWYTKDLKAKGLEVVFVSSDREEDAFNDYFKDMPWLALPYSQRELKESLSKRFRVDGIPSVVILDADGNKITTEGRAAICNDPTGEELPWRPKSLKQILASAEILGKDGAVNGAEALEGKLLGLYFSAHWCPPCRGFTPKLAEWYSASLKAKGLEILFVSSDKDEAAFADYFKDMPWLALAHSDRKVKDELSSKYKVEGIPSLIIVDADGKLVNAEGRAAVTSDPTGEELPWRPKPVRDFAGGPGSINEVPTVVAFCEGCSAEGKAFAYAGLEEVAAKYAEAQQQAGEDEPEKYGFMIARSAGGLAGRVRELLKLPSLPPSAHEHPMEKQGGSGWSCDGCGANGAEERFRCTAGCDFDYCGACMASAGSAASVPARLALVNVSDRGAYYLGPEGDITANAVRKLLADFEAGRLERKEVEG